TPHAECCGRSRTVLGTGLLIGLAALLSPALVPAAGLLFLVGLAALRDRRRDVLRAGFVLAGVAAVVITPWVVRNYRVLGGFVPLRSNFGLELALGNHAEANGKTFAVGWEDPRDPARRLQPFLNRDECTRLREQGELVYMQEKARTGRRC